MEWETHRRKAEKASMGQQLTTKGSYSACEGRDDRLDGHVGNAGFHVAKGAWKEEKGKAAKKHRVHAECSATAMVLVAGA